MGLIDCFHLTRTLEYYILRIVINAVIIDCCDITTLTLLINYYFVGAGLGTYLEAVLLIAIRVQILGYHGFIPRIKASPLKKE